MCIQTDFCNTTLSAETSLLLTEFLGVYLYFLWLLLIRCRSRNNFHKGVTPRIQNKEARENNLLQQAHSKQVTKLLHTDTHKHDTTADAQALHEGLHPTLEQTLAT